DPTNPNHELADPRFKYDREFLINEVCPAFLNYMIKGLEDLMIEGIDYSANADVMDVIRSENNHLFDAINEMGWRYDPTASLIRISTLYDQLEAWYVDQGILSKDFGRNSWQDPLRPSDQYITGSNRLFDRLKAIFPDIERQMRTPLGHSKRVPHIKGISVILDNPKQPTIPTPTHAHTDPTHAPTHAPTPVENGSKPVTPIVPTPVPTPPTPVLSKNAKINSKEDIDPISRAEIPPKNSNNDSGENKERLGNIGVGGVGKKSETITKQ
ncbi:MAG: hypothetical protein ACKPA7_32320, partial [Sphaerospermopsis kisseleviana]